MLRHYDDLGLLQPVSVDPWTGHRAYTVGQLARLNRLVALKDLGLTLDQIGPLLDDAIGADEVRALLQQRRVDLAEQARRTEEALRAVEHRLRLIEQENTMTSIDVVTKPLPTLHLTGLTTEVDSIAEVGGVVGPLFDRVVQALVADHRQPGVGTATYDERGGQVVVGAGFETGPASGLEPVEADAADLAATTIHLGSMEHISETWTALMQWIEANGYVPAGVCREVYLEAPQGDMSRWVTELQQPIRRA